MRQSPRPPMLDQSAGSRRSVLACILNRGSQPFFESRTRPSPAAGPFARASSLLSRVGLHGHSGCLRTRRILCRYSKWERRMDGPGYRKRAVSHGSIASRLSLKFAHVKLSDGNDRERIFFSHIDACVYTRGLRLIQHLDLTFASCEFQRIGYLTSAHF
jgi:hypothetical protein